MVVESEEENLIKFSENMDVIKRIEIHQKVLLDDTDYYGFTLDCKKSIIIPYKHYIEPYERPFRDLSRKNYHISKLFYDNAIKNEIKINKIKLDAFLKDFNKLNFVDDSKMSYFYKDNYKNTITIHTSIGEKHYDLTFNPDLWKRLGSLFYDLLGFDALNIKIFKNISTPHDYNICRDGVYDKQTGEKLSLESIEYGHGAVLDFVLSYNIHVDFLKNSVCGLIEKEDLSMEENKKILTMLKKNRVYEWVFDEFWNKAIYQECCCFDGYHWYLSLVFEGNRVLNIGGGNDFPDTFVNLAEEVKEFTNKDILKLKTMNEENIKLYKKYADLHLKEF